MKNCFDCKDAKSENYYDNNGIFIMRKTCQKGHIDKCNAFIKEHEDKTRAEMGNKYNLDCYTMNQGDVLLDEMHNLLTEFKYNNTTK